jgi:serine/threonine protein phosphatase PrpC
MRGDEFLKTAMKTDVGLVREVNEDRASVVIDLKGFTLAIVADGMGGHKAGEVASQIAVSTIEQELQLINEEMPLLDCKTAINDAILTANRRIYDLAFDQEQFFGMGTTVVVVLANKEFLVIAHIGDSRAYKINEHSIVQLTRDHSLVNELIKSGQISADEAITHPRRNVLTRALGTEKHVVVDIQHHPWDEREQLLLCSDGLTGLVEQTHIHSILLENHDLEWKVQKLVESALEAGGEDNVTVVLLLNEQIDFMGKE